MAASDTLLTYLQTYLIERMELQNSTLMWALDDFDSKGQCGTIQRLSISTSELFLTFNLAV